MIWSRAGILQAVRLPAGEVPRPPVQGGDQNHDPEAVPRRVRLRDDLPGLSPGVRDALPLLRAGPCAGRQQEPRHLPPGLPQGRVGNKKPTKKNY